MKQSSGTTMPILLVDDEEHILNVSRLMLQSQGFADVLTIGDSRKVMPLLAEQPVAAVVLDLYMPKPSGLELLPKIIEAFPQVPVIVMTAAGDTETAVQCMKTGAFDFLVKPVESERFVMSVKKAVEHRDLNNELTSLKQYLFDDHLEHPAAFARIVTASKKMRAVFQYVEIVAGTRQPIMITGETGVGKELIARSIHDLSGCKGEFVAVNVAGLDDAMFSDTLFGHRKGAFTGAEQARDGLIARASGGTLFLDEIGDLNESSQIKLLRLLQEQEYYPVGADIPRKSDARILLATNHDLQKLIAAGRFRNDLYYRLCTHQIHIPPLRERMDDLSLLLDHFLAESAAALNRKKPTPPPELTILLSTYLFPGNVRELQAMVFDAVARHGSGILSMDSFKGVIGDTRPAVTIAPSSEGSDEPLTSMFGRFPTVDEVEEYMIGEAMKLAKGNQGIAATLLGVTRQTLNKRLKNNHD